MASNPVSGVTEILFPKAIVYAFVVEADVLTIIDTGTPGGTGKVVGALRAAGHGPGDVGRIIITHRHADHASNAAELAKLTGAEIHVSAGDAPFFTEGREQPRPVAATPLGRVMVPYVKATLPWKLDPMAVRETLTDGADVGPFRVVGTPGHTAGHVSILWPERGVLFTGTRRRTSPTSARTPSPTTRTSRAQASASSAAWTSTPRASATGARSRPAPPRRSGPLPDRSRRARARDSRLRGRAAGTPTPTQVDDRSRTWSRAWRRCGCR